MIWTLDSYLHLEPAMVRKEFLGMWETEEGDSAARIEISEAPDGGLSVAVFNSWNGEVDEVSNVVVSTDFIEFDTRAPSSGSEIHVKMAVGQEDSLNVELTFYNVWVKTDREAGAEAEE